MSYILDALKKSERSRDLHRERVFRDAAALTPPATARALLAAAVLVPVLALAALFAARTLLAPAADPKNAAPAVAATEPQAVAAAATGTPAGPPPRVPVAPAAGLGGTGPSPAWVAAAPLDSQVQTAPAAAGPVPWLQGLPAELQRRLPPMAVNIHVYTPDAARRILYINNRPYQRGDPVEAGVVVEEIVPDGAVLSFQGQRFKLPRPS